MTRIAGVLAFLATAGTAALAHAQVQLLPIGEQYALSPPGARSLGMGAAFIALADDATASESNPAGLTILSKPELSGHVRFSSYTTEFPNTVTRAGTGTFDGSVLTPSFFSVVYPWKAVAVAAYFHRAADFDSTVRFEGVKTVGLPIAVTDEINTRLIVENLGASVATKVGGHVALGGSVRRTRVKGDSHTSRVASGSGSYFTADSTGDDVAVTFNAGVIVRATQKLVLGAVLKKGGAFELPTTSSGTLQPLQKGTAIQRFPGSFGAGIAARLTDRLTVQTDVVWVDYAGDGLFNLFGSAGILLPVAGTGGAPTSTSAPPRAEPIPPDLFQFSEGLDDAMEVHFGGEYTRPLANGKVVSLRAGGYSDPDHDGLSRVQSDQLHATLGAGIVIRQLQFDAAANLSKRLKEALLSFVVRF